MRWLLLKDLQILRRSPLQAALLIAYPILIAVLIGFAISRAARRSRGSPSSTKSRPDTPVSVGGEQLPAVGVSDRLCERVECVDVNDRGEAADEGRVRRRARGADPARRPGRQAQLALDA